MANIFAALWNAHGLEQQYVELEFSRWWAVLEAQSDLHYDDLENSSSDL